MVSCQFHLELILAVIIVFLSILVVTDDFHHFVRFIILLVSGRDCHLFLLFSG